MGVDINFLIFNMDSINIFYIYIITVISILSVVQNIVFFRKSIHKY